MRYAVSGKRCSSIRDAAQRGLKRYDFLRGAEDYKFDWASASRQTVSVLVARRNLTATLFAALQRAQNAARAAVESLLPERAAELMRRWHRSRRRKNGLGVKPPAPNLKIEE